MTTAPKHQFPCIKCEAPITCWPHQAPTAVCSTCLTSIRGANGRKVARARPTIGATALKRYKNTTYRSVYRPDHPDTTACGWMLEHRLVMEGMIGRRLTPAEVVHHRDRNGLNNSPDNLELIEDRGKHLAEEHCMEGVAARMALYPRCACGERAAFGATTCWACWKRSQTCPSCGRSGRKMARRDMCHGCYKQLRVKEGRLHRPPKAKSGD